MWAKLLILQLVLLAWQQQCNAECCTSTGIDFDPVNRTANKCSDYPGGKEAPFYKRAECETNLCGNLLTPSPCCGVGNCNIFCCNCDLGCLGEPGKTVVEEFKERYVGELKNVK